MLLTAESQAGAKDSLSSVCFKNSDESESSQDQGEILFGGEGVSLLTWSISHGDAILSACLNFNVVVADCIVAVCSATCIFQGSKQLVTPILHEMTFTICRDFYALY